MTFLARHDINGLQHGTNPLVSGPLLDLKHVGRHCTINYFIYLFLDVIAILTYVVVFYSYFNFFL